jgi:hypothetical protein
MTGMRNIIVILPAFIIVINTVLRVGILMSEWFKIASSYRADNTQSLSENTYFLC